MGNTLSTSAAPAMAGPLLAAAWLLSDAIIPTIFATGKGKRIAIAIDRVET